ncbi:MAG: N-acetylmuramoyl-L-alanine amidase [Verrucomicrobiales bacterium]|nr:N-acetylmuramoyl-L-alanine amidase [Verrucomicrobiales bacterium]
MKSSGCLAALGLALVLLGRSAPGASLDTFRLSNREYARVEDWARLRGFKMQRNPAAREVVLSNGVSRVELRVDSTRIAFNGIGLWFSYPVVLSDGQPAAAEQDLRGVLDALTQPRRLARGDTVRTICLDPGHGGKEPGQKVGNRLEKAYTLTLAQEVRTRLTQQGYNVVLTRRDDSYVDHPDRTELAKKVGADLFVSLHYNASADGGSDANGLEVYAMTPEGAKSTNVSADVGSLKAWAGNAHDAHNVLLAYHMQRALLKRLPGSEDRGVRRARFLVLRLAEMPAVLIEGGFMSNASDARWIYSVTGRKKMAQAIVDGINAYKKQVEYPDATPPQRSSSSKSSTKTARPESATN